MYFAGTGILIITALFLSLCFYCIKISRSKRLEFRDRSKVQLRFSSSSLPDRLKIRR
ncbi:hypothetical protein HOLDEFILI_00594 [Holdemania filiformis DSM 12042]|uniref:Uncharacterized protein n=1 Tax=Holdemania filiformis DSM 12042 TaxID=545696 RepID=B9Y464_9FIRM|nr:hypothetical protein HOLDEFILI_00594 [Holdemania filiformis DSM 12042]